MERFLRTFVFTDGIKEHAIDTEADSLEHAKGLGWDAAKEVSNKTGRACQPLRSQIIRPRTMKPQRVVGSR
jgi:hypothetical protein